MNHKPIEKQTVLITGASQGIGSEIALELAKYRVKLVLIYYHSQQSMLQVASLCMGYGAEVHCFSVNLSRVSDIQSLKYELDTKSLHPDILINNAGVSHAGLLTDVTEEDWEKVIAINLKATFFCSQVFVPYMVNQKYGKIINISSIWGIIGSSNEVLYSISKGGIITFTKALAKELAPSNITVNAIAPGMVDTQMIEHYTLNELEQLKQDIPLGRFAIPSEVSKVVAYLALPDSDYITGQIINISGGWHI